MGSSYRLLSLILDAVIKYVFLKIGIRPGSDIQTNATVCYEIGCSSEYVKYWFNL